MQTKLFTINDVQKNRDYIEQGALLLQQGELVAFPTETVYGLGADATNEQAVKKIFQAKGRPNDNPLIVHVAALHQLDNVVVGSLPKEVEKLAKHFWPGPLTVVLKSSEKISQSVRGGLETVAVRIPDHPVALALLKEVALPLAAPSANTSGRPSPTVAHHVQQDLEGKIAAILDGGRCQVGLESTVLDLTVPGKYVILRPGRITKEQLAEVLEAEVEVSSQTKDSAPLSPGQKYPHYSPDTPLYLVEGSLAEVRNKILEMVNIYQSRGKRVGVLVSLETVMDYNADVVEVLGSRADPSTMALNLFKSLREMDDYGLDVLLAEGIEEEGIGLAIMNRLRKAATDKIILCHVEKQ